MALVAGGRGIFHGVHIAAPSILNLPLPGYATNCMYPSHVVPRAPSFYFKKSLTLSTQERRVNLRLVLVALFMLCLAPDKCEQFFYFFKPNIKQGKSCFVAPLECDSFIWPKALPSLAVPGRFGDGRRELASTLICFFPFKNCR